jgi:DNA modification methylase
MRPSKDSQYCIHCDAWFGDFGLEPNYQMYIDHLMEIMEECWRVLVPWGNLFVNIGDSYSQSGGMGSQYKDGYCGKNKVDGFKKYGGHKAKGIPARSLVLIPERFAIAMVDRGWACRNDIIWHKPGPMPASDPTKFTPDHEYVYFFTKSNKIQYYINKKNGWSTTDTPLGIHGFEGLDWDWIPCPKCKPKNRKKPNGKCPGCKGKGHTKKNPPEGCNTCNGTGACPRCGGHKQIKKNHWTGRKSFFNQQFEPLKNPKLKRITSFGGTTKAKGKTKKKYSSTYSGRKLYDARKLLGKNRRSTWTIATASFPGSHFAVFPPKLAEIMIDAGTPVETCKQCGMPRERIINASSMGKSWHDHAADLKKGQSQAHGAMSDFYARGKYRRYFKGYTDCGCGAGFTLGIFMDIFMGAGTSGLKAKDLHRKYVGIEISPKYIEIAKLRIKLGDKGYRKHLKKEKELEGMKRLDSWVK